MGEWHQATSVEVVMSWGFVSRWKLQQKSLSERWCPQLFHLTGTLTIYTTRLIHQKSDDEHGKSVEIIFDPAKAISKLS